MNYKIKVNSEAESKEVQELFFELGGEWGFNSIQVKYKEYPYLFMTGIIIKYGKDSGFFEKHQNKEITLPELRDIVVLKRNDVGDATHEDDSGCLYFFSSYDTRVYYMTKGGWVKTREVDSSIKPIKKEGGMITGKEALMALANGDEVEYWCKGDPCIPMRWTPITSYNEYKLSYFLEKESKFEFRLKPKTILMNGVEVPKPFEPKNKNEKDFAFEMVIGAHVFYWKKREDYDQVVEALRKVFGGV